MVTITVTVSLWDISTSTLVDSARTVTDTTLVISANTRVNVITNAISVSVSSTVATTYA